MLQLLQAFDWQMLLLGEEAWSFLLETIFRTAFMFLVILLSLRLLGKRGIKQLSVFELGVIIGLGSAAGDPMFYKDVGLLPGLVVFVVVIGLYKTVTFFINRSDRFELFVEGEPVSLLKEGQFVLANFEKEPIAMDEFFAQLRLNSVSHLGQVQQAILETNGEISIFYFPDEAVRYGLPILPGSLTNKLHAIPQQATYACCFCGNVEQLLPAPVHTCANCQRQEWIKAINDKRIS